MGTCKKQNKKALLRCLEEEALFDTGCPIPFVINVHDFEHLLTTNPQVKEQIEGTTYGSHTIGHFGAHKAGFRQRQIIEKNDGHSMNIEVFNHYQWVKGKKYEFTVRIGIGIRTTIYAFWPLYYNQM